MDAHEFVKTNGKPEHFADLLDDDLRLACRFCGEAPLTTQCAMAAAVLSRAGCGA